MMRLFTAIFLFSCISTCYANVDFIGTYQCEGFDPYLNKKYSGTVVIKQHNAVFSLKMSYDTGEESIGVGGLYDPNTISVAFQDTNDLKKVGLERYALSEDGKKIQGYWVYLGQDKLGTEYCIKEDQPVKVK